jgi:hypothetical protein
MKWMMKCVNALTSITDFPIFAFSSSVYAEILPDVPINRILYLTENNEIGKVLNYAGCHKDKELDVI